MKNLKSPTISGHPTAARATEPPQELKDCPFCGDIAVLIATNAYGIPAFRVECVRCHSRSNLILGDREEPEKEDAKIDACNLWNQRAAT